MPTAIRLLRAIASNPPRLEIVDHDELARGITFAWNGWDESRCPQVLAAEAWVSWTKWEARQPSIAPLLKTTPLDKAVEVLGTSHPRWPSLWSQLSQSAPGDPRLEDLARRWLAAHFDDEGWSSIWCRITKQVVQRSVVTDEARAAASTLLRMGLQWLQTSLYQVAWSRVWEQLIETRTVFQPPIDIDALVARSAEWCAFNAEARDWNFVWEKLAAIVGTDTPNFSRKQVYELGLTWLKVHYNHPGWPFVWEHFMRVKVLPIKVAREALVEMAHSWRIDREGNPAWPYVAQMLTRTELRGAQVSFDASVTWIEQNRSGPQWPSSWVYWFEIRRDLLTHDQRRRLFMSACAWLADDDERDQATSVLRSLIVSLNTFGDDAHNRWLVNKATQVLSRSVDNDDPVWFDAWSVLFRHVKTLSTVERGDTSRTLTDLGQRWLATPSHLGGAGWYEMFNSLYGLGLCRDAWAHNLAITAICRGFISDVRGAKLASRLVSDEVKSTEPSGNLLDWLDQWFTTRANGSGGVFFWFTLDRAARAALERAPSPCWTRLKQILDVHRLGQISRWARIVEHYMEHRPISGRVIKTVLKKKNKNQPKQLGYVVDIGVNAYLSVEEANIEPGSEAERLSLVGQVAEFEIVRLDEERFQVDISRRAFFARSREDTDAR